MPERDRERRRRERDTNDQVSVKGASKEKDEEASEAGGIISTLEQHEVALSVEKGDLAMKRSPIGELTVAGRGCHQRHSRRRRWRSDAEADSFDLINGYNPGRHSHRRTETIANTRGYVRISIDKMSVD